ncbi:hypothetical protein ACRB68_54960 [Actinomadura sp. RB68]|uniref:Uncharacterized protein n=1 Tax=Actinomadura macrotermitis TaxID=2585200 RepID=A0A7K0C214_9ACTN|nr:hypothetical protein [Actinomadura macrotermitis]
MTSEPAPPVSDLSVKGAGPGRRGRPARAHRKGGPAPASVHWSWRLPESARRPAGATEPPPIGAAAGMTTGRWSFRMTGK